MQLAAMVVELQVYFESSTFVVWLLGQVSYHYIPIRGEGVLQADFVEPAHDKQGFERTPVLSKLESRLIQMQKTYWSVF